MSSIGKNPNRHTLFLGAVVAAMLILIFAPAAIRAQDRGTPSTTVVRVLSDASGQRLQVNGKDFMVFGMNWDYVPIGE
ncbi:MAG: hypothetical protein P8181_12835, partial [bacterium]